MGIVTPHLGLGLAPHVRACESDGQVILLDLRNSRYLGIGRPQSCALADRVQGWPRSPGQAPECASSAQVSQLEASLLARGLLTDRPFNNLTHAPVEVPTTSFDTDQHTVETGIGAARLTRFLWTAAATSLRLRFRSLQAIVTTVQCRRDRGQVCPSTAGSLDEMKTGTARYDRLRPFVFSARENCLHDSLALVDFLAAEGLFPQWVIGVKTRPFGAHSWVQAGSTVLNDQHETVRQFRPILVV